LFKLNPATLNCTQSSVGKDKSWLLDSGASHNISSDLANLLVHSEYDGIDEVFFSDGSGLAVSYTGSLTLPFPKCLFTIHDTLYVPNLQKKKNIIFVHCNFKQNDVFVEFHFFYFLIDNQFTKEILLRGACNNGMYTFPSTPLSNMWRLCMNRLPFDG